MRINLLELARTFDKSELQADLNYVNETYKFNLTLDSWSGFMKEMAPIQSRQIELFAWAVMMKLPAFVNTQTGSELQYGRKPAIS